MTKSTDLDDLFPIPDPDPLMVCTLQLDHDIPPEMFCWVHEELVHMAQTPGGEWCAVSLESRPSLPLHHASGSVTTTQVALAHYVAVEAKATGDAPSVWLERIVESAERILQYRGRSWDAADAEDIVESIFGPEAAVAALADFASWLPVNGYRVPPSFGSDLSRWLAWFQFRSASPS